MDENSVVYIDGKEHELRNDGTIYLGMNTWLRIRGTRQWFCTGFHGRATLLPGMHYDSMIRPEGQESMMVNPWWQRVQWLLSYFL